MAKNLQIFKGGWSNGREDRLAVNQRPADGHIKAAAWEDYIRVNKQRFTCSGVPDLKVGDVIGIHTCLTFGLIEAFGLAVLSAEDGLKLKVVCSDPEVDLSQLQAVTYQYDADNGAFTKVANEQALTAISDIGNDVEYIAAIADGRIRVSNACQIGLEVVALPSEGLQWTFDIESRLQMRQPVRPPAALPGECC